MKKILETARLYCRRFTPDDVQLIIDLNNNPEVTRYTGDGPVKDEQEAKRILEEIIIPQYEKNIGRWAVHLKGTREFIGWCGLKDLGEGVIDIGYRFFQQHWGKGYATEIASAVLDHGLYVLKLNNIIGRASAQNTASVKVLEKIGLTYSHSYIEEDHGQAEQCVIYKLKTV